MTSSSILKMRIEGDHWKTALVQLVRTQLAEGVVFSGRALALMEEYNALLTKDEQCRRLRRILDW